MQKSVHCWGCKALVSSPLHGSSLPMSCCARLGHAHPVVQSAQAVAGCHCFCDLAFSTHATHNTPTSPLLVRSSVAAWSLGVLMGRQDGPTGRLTPPRLRGTMRTPSLQQWLRRSADNVGLLSDCVQDGATATVAGINCRCSADQLVKAAAAAAAKRASASVTTVFGEELPAEATLQQAISTAGQVVEVLSLSKLSSARH